EERYAFAYNSYIASKRTLIRPILHAAPLIFMEISREWRDIAISLCDMWLKRSGSLPLVHSNLSSHTIAMPPKKSSVLYQDLLRVILPYAERCRFLLANRILRDLLPESVPILEDLGFSYHTRSADSTPWEGLRTAPKLRVLYFDSICGTEAGQWLSFPWSQLTHIDVRRCSAYDCLHILRAASACSRLRVHRRAQPSSDHSPVSHSGLQTLKIEVYADLCLLWNRLTCPELSILEIGTEREPFTPHGGLPSFIARSGGNYTKLHILRHLDVAEFSSSQFTNEVWESLTWRPDRRLRSFRISNHYTSQGGNNCSHKAVAQMLESTGSIGQTVIEKGVSCIFPKCERSVWERFIAFQKLGLNITLDMTEISDAEIGGSDSDAESDDSEDHGDSEAKMRRGKFSSHE
ncbi:hypothetical protein B0H14DRAFT_2993792, partial [Mycena olivaceomarginata]